MILSTTDSIPGRTISSIEGIVHAHQLFVGSAADGFQALAQLLRGKTDHVEESYSEELGKTYNLALEALKEKARQMGCDAVVSVQMDFNPADSILFVNAVGTGVRLD